jgi:hypothetical protein
MTNDLLIYIMMKIFMHFLIYVLGSPSSYMTLHPIPSEFPYICEENFVSFLSVLRTTNGVFSVPYPRSKLGGLDWKSGSNKIVGIKMASFICLQTVANEVWGPGWSGQLAWWNMTLEAGMNPHGSLRG